MGFLFFWDFAAGLFFAAGVSNLKIPAAAQIAQNAQKAQYAGSGEAQCGPNYILIFLFPQVFVDFLQALSY